MLCKLALLFPGVSAKRALAVANFALRGSYSAVVRVSWTQRRAARTRTWNKRSNTRNCRLDRPLVFLSCDDSVVLLLLLAHSLARYHAHHLRFGTHPP